MFSFAHFIFSYLIPTSFTDLSLSLFHSLTLSLSLSFALSSLICKLYEAFLVFNFISISFSTESHYLSLSLSHYNAVKLVGFSISIHLSYLSSTHTHTHTHTHTFTHTDTHTHTHSLAIFLPFSHFLLSFSQIPFLLALSAQAIRVVNKADFRGGTGVCVCVCVSVCVCVCVCPCVCVCVNYRENFL